MRYYSIFQKWHTLKTYLLLLNCSGNDLIKQNIKYFSDTLKFLFPILLFPILNAVENEVTKQKARITEAQNLTFIFSFLGVSALLPVYVSFNYGACCLKIELIDFPSPCTQFIDDLPLEI